MDKIPKPVLIVVVAVLVGLAGFAIMQSMKPEGGSAADTMKEIQSMEKPDNLKPVPKELLDKAKGMGGQAKGAPK